MARRPRSYWWAGAAAQTSSAQAGTSDLPKEKLQQPPGRALLSCSGGHRVSGLWQPWYAQELTRARRSAGHPVAAGPERGAAAWVSSA